MQSVKSVKIISGVTIVLGFLALIGYFYTATFFKTGETPTIVIRNCSSLEPNPIVVKSDISVRLVNGDSKSHVIKLAGNSFIVKAAQEKELAGEFVYGAGTYAYDCDDVPNVGQIQIVAPEQDLKGTEQTFKELYDSVPKELQSCTRKLLGGKFEKVYSGEEIFILGSKDQETINSCLSSSQQTPRQ